MRISRKHDPKEQIEIKIRKPKIETVQNFRYMGTIRNNKNDTNVEIKQNPSGPQIIL